MEEDLIEIRRKKWEKWEGAFGERLPEKYEITRSISEVVSEYASQPKEFFEENKIEIRTAGRMIAFRKMGKLTFSHILDAEGKIQILFEKNIVGKDFYEKLSLLDIGDIIGVEGYLLKTRTGELSIAAQSYKPLSKCLKPLPEKWHGLTDIEQRYRQRYLDLIINPESKGRFINRIKMVEAIRKFMSDRNYLEVETPMLQPIAGGAAAKPFSTHHNALNLDLFLRIAPELYLKRLVVGGFNKVFEINRNFRNEGIDSKHNPEFTMMEFYEAFSSMEDFMKMTEEMLLFIAKKIYGSEEIPYMNEKISFKAPFKRIDLLEEAKKILLERGIKEGEWEDPEKMNQLIVRLDLSKEKARTPMRFLVEVFDTFVAPRLIQPTFVVGFPLEVSPLSRKKDDCIVQRFELFIAGMEIANGFSELNDPDDQRERFISQAKEKLHGDQEAMSYDEDYCNALDYALPPTAGEGIGIDRLSMIFANTDSIRDVLFFPLLKPQKTE